MNCLEKFLEKIEIFPKFIENKYMNTILSDKKSENILGKYTTSFENDIAVLINAKKGLRAQAVFDFMKLSEFPFDLVEDVLNKTIKTFISYRKNRKVLDPVTSEKILKLFALYKGGITVFGNVEHFNKWMGEPAWGLGNQVPVRLLDTITGIDLIDEELTRIQYGDLA